MSDTGPQELNSKRNKFQPRKKRKKLNIVFDENARREFLTGFHKRKVQRKNKAKEEFERQLKAERKRIKAEAKKQYMKLLLAQKPVPEISDLLSENIDMGTHSVSVTELSTADLARKNNWIGINEIQYQERGSEEEEEEEEEENGRVRETRNRVKLEGMDVKKKDNSKSIYKTIPAKSFKDIKKKIKQQAATNVKNSKIFQKKAEYEKNKNLKLIRRQEKKLKKFRKKDKRSKHKNFNK